MAKVIGIISLKGGVGKTSLTAALGGAMASLGKKVLIVDGNLSAPNLGLHFNLVNPKISLHHVLAREAKPSEAIYHLENLDIMPASIFEKPDVSALKLKDRLAALKDKYDVILLDSSPSLNDETLGVMLASDEILVVTTPDHATLSNTVKAVTLAKQRGAPISGLILNKVYDEDFELSLNDIEDVTEVPVLAVIPHDVNMLKALSEFKTYTDFKPKSKGSEELRRLSSTLLGEKYEAPMLKKFLWWFAPEKQEINRQVFYDEVFR
ncbi:MAG: AAA family ATPase [Nanoarchaeota archaeon]